MKATNLYNGWLHSCLTLSFVVGGMVIFACPTKAQSVLANTVYKVDLINVKNNGAFQKCFRFQQLGVLKIDNTGDGRYDSRNSKENNDPWQAVITTNPFLGISGLTSGADFDDKPPNIAGNVINNNGSIFTFTGKKDPQCIDAAINSGIDPLAE